MRLLPYVVFALTSYERVKPLIFCAVVSLFSSFK